MGRNKTIHNTIGLISVMLIFAVLTFGCYNRDVAQVADNTYGRGIYPAPLTREQIGQFTRTVRKVDGEAQAHYRMALYFQERHRDRLAIDELNKVIKRDPTNAKAYNAIGVSFDNLGDCNAAIAYYKQALQIDPNLDYVYNNLGYSLLLRKDIPSAVDAFQQAIALNGREKRYHNNLGLAYAKQDKFDLAYAQFKEQNNEADADKLLAKVMKDMGKSGQVDAVLLAVKNTPAPEAQKEVLAEAKPEAPAEMVAAAKVEAPEAVKAEIKTEDSQKMIAETRSDLPANETVEARPEDPKAEHIETKPVDPEVVVAESTPVTHEEKGNEKKVESSEIVVAESKHEVPKFVESAPALPKQPEVVEIASVQPLNTDVENNTNVQNEAATEVKVPETSGEIGAVNDVTAAKTVPDIKIEDRPEATKVEHIEAKPVVPEVVVAESTPVTHEEKVNEKKAESSEIVVAESKLEVPKVVEAAPALPKQPEVVEIAAAEPLNAPVEIVKSEKKEAAAVEKTPKAHEELAVFNTLPAAKTTPDVHSKVPAEMVAEAAVRASGGESDQGKPVAVTVAMVEAPAVPLPFKTSENVSSGAATVQVHDMKILTARASLPAAATASDPKKADKEIQIVVENGNGVKGAAGKVAEQLRRNGFKVIKVADARSFDHYSTKVFFYAGNVEEVRRMIKVIPSCPKDTELYRIGNTECPVRLLIGRDAVKEKTSPARKAKPEVLKADSGGKNQPAHLKKKKA